MLGHVVAVLWLHVEASNHIILMVAALFHTEVRGITVLSWLYSGDGHSITGH